MSEDPDRSRVYAAEDAVLAMLDATSPEDPVVRLGGESFVPEPEARFSDVADVERFVPKVLAHLREGGHDFGGRERVDVRVRMRRGATRAHYEHETATIAVPPRRRGGGWALREHVVLHELAHHLSGEAHGPGFRSTHLRLLEALGHPTTAYLLSRQHALQGLAGAVPEETDEASLQRIAKLLRQAEGTGNEHERDAFLTRAQALATRHSVALAVARAHTAKREARQQPEHREFVIGEPGARGLSRYVLLMVRVGAVNDVRFTVQRGNTVMTGHGFPADLDVVEALWQSLIVQMVAACERWLATGAHRGERVRRWDDRRRRWVDKPMPTITARLSFYESFIDRVGERLEEAKEQAIAEAVARDSDRTPVSTSLALREKTKAVEDYFAEENSRRGVRGSWRGSFTSADSFSEAADGAGRRAADRADLTGESSRGRLGAGGRGGAA